MQQKLGTVLKSTGSRFGIMMDEGEVIDAVLRGKFRLEGNRSTNPVAVGDRVEIETINDDNTITKILPRRNHIKRKSINLSKESHILAANIDLVVIVITLIKPYTPIEFIDRILLNAEAYGIAPLLVFNKSDLYSDKEEEKYQEMNAIYTDIGYQCIKVSALEGDMVGLEKLLSRKISFFIGQSGVGKSTLINRLLPNLDLATKSLSDSYDTGKHTTTFAEMYPLNKDTFIIDSPGVKAFGILDLEKEEVGLYFPELKKRLPECKFYNCMHINEPKCAVKEAVESGYIAWTRYKSYVSIVQDFDEENQFRIPDHLK